MKLEVVERKVRQIWQDVCSEPLSSPNEVLAYLDTLDIASADREVFIVLHLDTRNRVVAHGRPPSAVRTRPSSIRERC